MISKKGISQIISVSLLVVVSVSAVIGFQFWFQEYSSSLYNSEQTNTDHISLFDLKYATTQKLYLSSSFSQEIQHLEVQNSSGSSMCTFKLNIPDFESLIQDDNLVAWWKFDSNNSTLFDSSGNDYLGDVYGTSYNPICMNYGCYIFDGDDDYIEINHSLDPVLTSDFSLSLWVASNKDDGYYIIGNRNWANRVDFSAQGFALIASNNPQEVIFNINNDSDLGGYHSEVVLPRVYNFTHIGIVKNSSEVEIYINGELKDSISSVNNYDTPNNLFIGKPPNINNRHLEGSIDEIFLFNRTLTRLEVQTIYNSTALSFLDKVKIIDVSSCNLSEGQKYSLFAINSKSTFEEEFIAK